GGDGTGHRRRRLLEDDEQGVAARAHFLAAVAAEGGAHELVVGGEKRGVPITEALEKVRRPLQVGEEKRQRAGRQPPIRHDARLVTACDTYGASAEWPEDDVERGDKRAGARRIARR